MTDATLTWVELHPEISAHLRSAGTENAETEARWLIEEASGLAWADVTGESALVTEKRLAHLDSMVSRRRGGEPLQYVLGHWPFRRLDLMVDRRVLIPRPETEQVVSVALSELEDADRPEHTVVDLGTGSGAIALSIALECPSATVWACDVSEECIAVARANAAGLGRPAARVSIACGSWYEALPDALRGSVDLIVANPPYVPAGEELPSVITAWEPRRALYSGADGLDDINAIIEGAPEWVAPGAAVVIEMGPGQVSSAIELMRARGFTDLAPFTDLADTERGVVGRWRS